MDSTILKRRIRRWLVAYIAVLVVIAATTFPLRAEIDWLARQIGEGTATERHWPAMAEWISSVHRGVTETDDKYPFFAYGTDWLAFAHIVIAIAFIGPLRDPVRNIWVVHFGMIACGLVIPLALICGLIRGIPFFWRLIDCTFGIIGIIPLYLIHRNTRRLAAMDEAYVRAKIAQGMQAAEEGRAIAHDEVKRRFTK